MCVEELRTDSTVAEQEAVIEESENGKTTWCKKEK